MGHVTVSLRSDPDGSVRVDATAGVASCSQVVTATVVAGLREQMAGALPEFDDGRRPFADPVVLAELGARLRDTFFRGVVVRGQRSGRRQRPGPHLRQSHPIGAGCAELLAGTLTG